MPRIVRSTFRRTAKRMVEWGLLVVENTTVDTTVAVVLGEFAAATLEPIMPATLVRTRGLFYVHPDNPAAQELKIGAAGMYRVQDQARVVGITALPAPFDEGQDDGWIWYQPWLFRGEQAATGEPDSQQGREFVVDSKAQRKLEQGDALVFTAQGSTNATGVQVMLWVRCLFKLH